MSKPKSERDYKADIAMLKRDLLQARIERDNAINQLDERDREIKQMEKWNAQCDEKQRQADAYKEGQIRSLEHQLDEARKASSVDTKDFEDVIWHLIEKVRRLRIERDNALHGRKNAN